MPAKKTELVSFRATPEFKRALKLAAEADKRSQANFLEKLLLDYCSRLGLPFHEPDSLGPTAPNIAARRKFAR
jgi:hypothetical protein